MAKHRRHDALGSAMEKEGYVLKTTRGRKLGLVLAAVGVSVISIAAASAQTTAKGPSSQRGELRIVTHTATQASMEPLIKNFNIAYPNIKVDIQYIPTGPTLNTGLLAMINSGNAPDIFFSHPSRSGDVASPPLARAGRLLDLTKRPFVKRIPKADKAFFTVNKKVWVEPIYKVASGWIINKTAFDKNGWKVPTTFAQVLTLCDKAKETGGNLFSFAGPITAESLLNTMGATFVFSSDPNWLQKKAQGKVSFSTSPLWANLFRHVIMMRDRGCFMPGWQAASVTDLGQRLAQGKTFSSMAPSAALSTYNRIVPNTNFIVVPFPGDRASQTRGMMGYNFGLAVSAQSKNKAAALAFIDFAGREGQSRLQAQINGSASLVQVNTGKLPAALAAYAPFIKANKIVARPDAQFPTATTNSNFNAVAGKILINGDNISDALKLLDDTWGK
jgi:raffinose/stachyose/melibiose transport system substrate-binding protein